ncbi:hypothetical protein F5887DRAFT_919469 [Amanita rubescens]|nr:hypothetical protein F5887DRAFT_919469 [Amanita rubescens]
MPEDGPNATPRECPKFWDDTHKKVLDGVNVRKTESAQLADMLGTYVWVFSGDPQMCGDLEKMRRGDFTDDAGYIANYSIKLGAANHRPDQPVAPEDISGQITFYTLKVAFDGLRRVRNGWSPSAAARESFWEVLLVDEDQDYFDMWWDIRDNAVAAAVVLDDNGFPFLVYDWQHPGGCQGAWTGYYLGKRSVEGKDWRLTDEERARLGIGATFRSVEQLVKEGSPGVYSEDSEEEDDSCGRGAGGSNGEKAVGKKGKASTDETGAKKRKASTDGTDAKKVKTSTDEAGAKASTNETGAKKMKTSTDEAGAKASTNETGTKKMKTSTDEAGAIASTDETGAKKRRKRRRRRA